MKKNGEEGIKKPNNGHLKIQKLILTNKTKD